MRVTVPERRQAQGKRAIRVSGGYFGAAPRTGRTELAPALPAVEEALLLEGDGSEKPKEEGQSHP